MGVSCRNFVVSDLKFCTFLDYAWA